LFAVKTESFDPGAKDFSKALAKSQVTLAEFRRSDLSETFQEKFREHPVGQIIVASTWNFTSSWLRSSARRLGDFEDARVYLLHLILAGSSHVIPNFGLGRDHVGLPPPLVIT